MGSVLFHTAYKLMRTAGVCRVIQGKHPHFLNHNALDKDPRAPSRTQSVFSCPPLAVPTGTGCDVLRTKANGALPPFLWTLCSNCYITERCRGSQLPCEFKVSLGLSRISNSPLIPSCTYAINYLNLNEILYFLKAHHFSFSLLRSF